MDITDRASGFSAVVTSTGSLQTTISGIVGVSGSVSISSGTVGISGTVDIGSVSGEVTTRPSPTSTTDLVETPASVGTSDAELVEANADRKQIQIHNSDTTNPMFIRLKDDVATSAYIRIGPGVTYSFPPGVTYTGSIHAIAQGGTVAAIVYEF